MYFFSGDRRRTARSLLEAFLATPEVRTLQRMGFKRRTLEIVIKHQLQKTGKAHSHDFFGFFFHYYKEKRGYTWYFNLSCAGRWFSSVEDMFESVVHYHDNGCCIDLSCCRRSPSREYIWAVDCFQNPHIQGDRDQLFELF